MPQTKKRLGRPPLPKEEKRSRIAHIPLTPEEERILDAKMRKAKATTRPAFIRSLIFG